jgi:hypothetical protein
MQRKMRCIFTNCTGGVSEAMDAELDATGQVLLLLLLLLLLPPPPPPIRVQKEWFKVLHVNRGRLLNSMGLCVMCPSEKDFL